MVDRSWYIYNYIYISIRNSYGLLYQRSITGAPRYGVLRLPRAARRCPEDSYLMNFWDRPDMALGLHVSLLGPTGGRWLSTDGLFSGSMWVCRRAYIYNTHICIYITHTQKIYIYIMYILVENIKVSCILPRCLVCFARFFCAVLSPFGLGRPLSPSQINLSVR